MHLAIGQKRTRNLKPRRHDVESLDIEPCNTVQHRATPCKAEVANRPPPPEARHRSTQIDTDRHATVRHRLHLHLDPQRHSQPRSRLKRLKIKTVKCCICCICCRALLWFCSWSLGISSESHQNLVDPPDHASCSSWYWFESFAVIPSLT